jgi:FtsP/CotA-like multicopper oxidase with cupredoxin domain
MIIHANNDPSSATDLHIDRRRLLLSAGAAALGIGVARAQTAAAQADYTIRIAPLSLELAPNKTIRTTGYNGSVPGPVLRLRQGKPVSINVINDAGYPDIVHWHGLYLPAVQDGATEEGSPIIPVGQSHLYSFTPKPAGTRWYHSHAMAMTDLNRSTYTGEFGFLIVEPAAGEPGSYDREVLLAARRWEGEWVSMQDIKKGPPPNNGLEVMYHSATLGARMLGYDEPIRVREG